MRKSSWFLVLTGFLMATCSKPQEPTELTHLTYYRVDSLLDAQLQYLVSQNAHLQKKTDVEDVFVTMDSLQWVNALAIFRILDINNPSLKEAYTVRDQLKDSVSNLTILHYELKDEDDNQPLKMMSVYYLDSIHHLKKIVANTSYQSIIYHSNNQFDLTFDQSQKQTILKSYTIAATQKTMCSDSINTIVDFEIRY